MTTRVFVFSGLLLIGLVGAVCAWIATRWGVGLATDSLTYIEAARNLAGGHGFSTADAEGTLEPMTHWPPLFPAAIAVPAFIGLDASTAARAMNAGLFGVNLVLVGFLAGRCAPRSTLAPLLAAGVALLSGSLLELHSMALSEPLYLAFALIGLSCLASHSARPQISILVAGGAFVALATLTRYLGLSLIATGGITLLLVLHAPTKTRIRDSAIFGVISSLPLFFWLLRNRSVAGSASDTPFVYHPITPAYFIRGLDTITIWFFPTPIPLRVRAAVLAVMLLGVILAYLHVRSMRHSDSGSREADLGARQQTVLIIHIVVYCVTLAAVISFVDLDVGFDHRYLAPVFMSVVILASGVLGNLFVHMRALHVRRLLVVALAAFFMVATLRSGRSLRYAYASGLGFSGPEWTNSEILRGVKALPPEVKIYTNARRLVYFMTGRVVGGLPWKYDQHTGLPNADFRSQVLRLAPEHSTEKRYLVLLNKYQRSYQPTEQELKELLRLTVVESLAEGSIFAVSPRMDSSDLQGRDAYRGLFDFHGPTDAQFQVWNKAAAAHSELRDESIRVLKSE